MNSSIFFYVFLGFCLIAILPQMTLCFYSKNKVIDIAFIFLLLFCASYEYVLIKLDEGKSQEDIFYFSRFLLLTPSILITLQAILVSRYVNIFHKRLFWLIMFVSGANFIVNLFFQLDLILVISNHQQLLSKLQTFIIENRYQVSTISNFILFFIFIFLCLLLAFHYTNSRNNEALFLLVIVVSQAFLITSTFYGGAVRMHSLLLELCNVLLVISVSIFTSLQIKNKEVLYASILRQKKMSLFKDEITNFILTDFKEPLDILNNIKPTDSKEEIITTVELTSFKMLNNVVNMLDVYKYNQREIILNKSICNIEQVLNRSVIRFNSVFEKKNISVNINYSTDHTITIDENLIERVLVNILDTFTENMDKKAIIDISVSKLNYEKLIIRISCFGVHFSRLRISHFTNILENSDTNAYDNYSDMLSLSFCKMVIEAHEGEIWFEFDKKLDHVVCITLPNETKNKPSIDNMQHAIQHADYKKIKISDNEKRRMSKYYQLLQETQLFEITKLRLLIVELEKDKSINADWLFELKVSIREMHDDRYSYLKDVIKSNKQQYFS